MRERRKMLYISVFINFIVGIIIGTVLFYGQMRAEPVGEAVYIFDSNVTFTDFLRASWMNLIWLMSSFVAEFILPGRFIYPVMTIRGTACSFSVLYLLSFLGIKEAAASVIPQCFSSLPLLSLFSVECAIRRRNNLKNGIEMCQIRRSEAVAILLISMLSGGIEVIFFRFLCTYLF